MPTPNQKNIISFFIAHPEYFIRLLSRYYPFSIRQLQQYKNILEWTTISENTSILWSREIMHTFSDQLDWNSISRNSAAFKNISLLEVFSDKLDWLGDPLVCGDSLAANEGLPWDMAFIEKYESKIDLEKLSYNTKVKWSEELLSKYIGRWDMVELAGNSSFPWNLHLFEKYLDLSYLSYFHTNINDTLIGNFEFVNKYKKEVDWSLVSANQNLPWIQRDLLNYWKPFINWWGIAYNHIFFLNDTTFFKTYFDKWERNAYHNFLALSYNEVLPWSIPFIEKYMDYWDWDSLSLNEGLPWSVELIDHFSAYFTWGGTREVVPYEDNGDIIIAEHEMGLIENNALPWSIGFLKYFENKLEFRALARNNAVWPKAFKPFVNDKMIETVMRII